MSTTKYRLPPTDRRARIAILDDYLNCARTVADWSAVSEQADITVFNHGFANQDEAIRQLQGFDVLAIMRERMALPRSVIEALPDLRMIAMTGLRHPGLDAEAANERGIAISTTSGTPKGSAGTVEIAWGLLLSLSCWLPQHDAQMRRGNWQLRLGSNIEGKRLGLIGLGKLGAKMVPVAHAFGMDVVAWSPNLTHERAREAGVALVSKQELLQTSDFASLHIVLSSTTRGLIDTQDLALMKPTAFLINTSRGPLVREEALLQALQTGVIAGAGLDVYDHEPLAPDHPLRSAPNTVLTPHLGYSTREELGHYYAESVRNVLAWLDGKPVTIWKSPA